MAILLSIYTDNAFREIRLPMINNSDFSLVLYKNIYGIENDVTLNMQVIDDEWQIISSKEYSIFKNEDKYNILTLKDKDIIKIFTKSEMISVVVKYLEQVFVPFEKYDISSENEIKIGKNDTNDICYSYAGLVSREHAIMRKSDAGWQIENRSSNGIYVNSAVVQNTTMLEFGDYISVIGLHMVYLGDILAIDNVNSDVIVSDKIKKITIQDDENSSDELLKEERFSGNKDKKVLVLRAPRNMGVLNKEVTVIKGIGDNGLPFLGNFFNSRYKRNQQAYLKYLDIKENEIFEKYQHNVNVLNSMYKSSSECASNISDKSKLWNRNSTHKDFLCHRIGTGDISFQSQIKFTDNILAYDSKAITDRIHHIKEDYEVLRDVPICVDLLKQKLIGVTGGYNCNGAMEVMKSLCTQIAFSNSYTDVKMIFIYNEMSASFARKYQFAKWFPHVWSDDKKSRYVASNKEEASDIFYEIARILRRREGSATKPHFVMFLAAPQFMEGELISKYVFDMEKDYGLTTVILADEVNNLPNACDFIIQNDESFKGIYSLSASGRNKTRVDFDFISDRLINSFSRELSNYYVKDVEKGGEVPNSLTFMDMHGVSRVSDFNVIDRWRKSKVYENIRGMIGQTAGGEPCYLDIHEKYHGPHGLVAGTTGSGKSEILQSFMLSLAINYGPDDIGFFIIDYKGGGMANLFNGLPHLIGQISNLSGNQVHRAMVSIKSENRRRQRLFNECGVNNINTYTKLYKKGDVKEPLPHLLIIVDEFAELKREEPEFMRNLISVAQVGRSLGVHLILSTQKPSGTVDDNIWSNSKFRLCMRVQDKEDSIDIIHRPDAAYITQAGRGYLQVGNDEVFELFQSGFSGAVYDDEIGQRNSKVKIYMLNGKEDIESELYHKNTQKKSRELTQLEAVTEYLAEVARDNNYKFEYKLWMPVLEEKIYLEDLCRNYTPKGDDIEVVLGEYDDPKNQDKGNVIINFTESGHLGIYGLPGNGKTTGLQTILYSLIVNYNPDELWFYGIDFSGKSMWPFEKAPQCGGIIYEDDEDKIDKFFVMIESIITERKSILKGANYLQYNKTKSSGEKLTTIIIAIDNFGAFNGRTKEAYLENVIRISKEGTSLGIYLILTGNNISAAEISPRIADNLVQNICYEMPDEYEYKKVFHTNKIEVIPEAGIKGRGLVNIKGDILEYQTAIAVEALDDYSRLEKIDDLCNEMKLNWKGEGAKKIPTIPDKLQMDDFTTWKGYKEALESKYLLPVGLQHKDVSLYSLDLRNIYCYLVTGGYRTGKKNFLKVLMQVALEKDSKIAVIDSSGFGMKMKNNKHADRITYVYNDKEIFDYFNELMPEFIRRNNLKNNMLEEGMEESEIYERMCQEERIFICIPNLSWFIKSIYNSSYNLKSCLENIIEKGSLHNIYIVANLDIEDRIELDRYELFNLFVSYRTGIHFGGNIGENRFFNFDSLSYKEQGRLLRPGIGYTAGGIERGVNKIVVPLARR